MSFDDRNAPGTPSALLPGATSRALHPTPPVQRRRGALSAPAPMSRMKFILILVVATGLAVALVMTLHYVLVSSSSYQVKPVLAAEFKDQINEMADFAFRPPRNWQIDDRTQKYTYYVKGPSEKGFFPLMIFTSITSPSTLQVFVDEHKKRLQITEPSVKFISEEDDSIDGCRTKRIEYDCDYQETDTSPVLKLRTLQFIVKDPSFPEYFKITCHSKTETYASHVEEFGASAHSFRRVEIKATVPKYLPAGK